MARQKPCPHCSLPWDEHCEMCGRATDKGLKKYGGDFEAKIIMINKKKAKRR